MGLKLIPQKSNIQFISIIRKFGGESLISVKYESDSSLDEDLVSAFLQAFSIYAGEGDSQDGLSSIEKDGFNYIIEATDKILGVIVLTQIKDEQKIRKDLRDLCKEFEDIYDYHLSNWNGNISHFREFLIYIVSKFPPTQIDYDLVPIKFNNGSTRTVGQTAEIIENVKKLINGKRTVFDIIKASEIPEEFVIGALSLMYKFNEIKFKISIKEEDRPKLIGRISPHFRRYYADVVDQLAELCNGEMTIKEISSRLGIEFSTTKFILEKLADSGAVKFI